jgi:hypothetical protein
MTALPNETYFFNSCPFARLPAHIKVNMNSPSQGMSLFGKFRMLEQKVNELTLNQPNTLDVSLFGNDKLKKLEQKVEDMAQVQRHKFSVYTDEINHQARDFAALKKAVFEEHLTDNRRISRVESECKQLRTDLTASVKLCTIQHNRLLIIEQHIARLVISVEDLQQKTADIPENTGKSAAEQYRNILIQNNDNGALSDVSDYGIDSDFEGA